MPNPLRRAARRDGFQARYGFKQDYYALKSHCIPTIASRLALPNRNLGIVNLGIVKIITQ